MDADIEYGGYSWACFKAQQAAEPALKGSANALRRASLYSRPAKAFEKAVGLCGEEPPDRVKDCVYMLDKMYTPPRYPDAFPEGAPWEHYTEREAVEAKKCPRRC